MAHLLGFGRILDPEEFDRLVGQCRARANAHEAKVQELEAATRTGPSRKTPASAKSCPSGRPFPGPTAATGREAMGDEEMLKILLAERDQRSLRPHGFT